MIFTKSPCSKECRDNIGPKLVAWARRPNFHLVSWLSLSGDAKPIHLLRFQSFFPSEFFFRSAIPVSLAKSESFGAVIRWGRRLAPARSCAYRRTSSRRRSPSPHRGTPAAPLRSPAPSATPPGPMPYGPASCPATSRRSLTGCSPALRLRRRRSGSFASPTAIAPSYSPMASGYGRPPKILYSPMASRYGRPPARRR